jgi:2,4-dienoyl-CoA reductase-like NADH-dependent reductase (Old Yellow Enzyme family)
MLIIEMLFNENLIKAEFALNQANSDNIVELCREYLQILTEYREDLYKLRGSPDVHLQQSSRLASELVEQVRKAIRSTVEITTLKRNQTELLLESFISISGCEAVETFNRLKYRGFDNWQLRANSVNSQNNEGFDQIALREAVETASLLRREAYINDKTTFLGKAQNGYSPEIVESTGGESS